MAINIEWQVKPPSKNGEKSQMFPHITDSYTVSEQQLAELITRAEFEHVFGLRRTTAYIRLKELEKMGECREWQGDKICRKGKVFSIICNSQDLI